MWLRMQMLPVIAKGAVAEHAATELLRIGDVLTDETELPGARVHLLLQVFLARHNSCNQTTI